MDDRGRLAQSLTGIALCVRARGGEHLPAARAGRADAARRYSQSLERWAFFLAKRLPRRVGLRATFILMLATIAYGIVRGDHLSAVVLALKDGRDSIANMAGLRVISVALAG